MNKIIDLINKNKVLFFIIITGSLLLLAIIIPFEKKYCLFNQCGLWLVDKIRARDDFWQIALSQASYKSFPFEFPNAAGMPMHGYHILYSILLYVFSKILFDPLFINGTLYPILWIVLYSYLSYLFIKKISTSHFVKTLFIFLQFFGGSFGYFFTLYHKNTFLFSEGMTYQPILYLTNKPLSLSIILFLAAVIFILNVNNLKRSHVVLLGLLVFFIWGAKFHAGAAICVFIAAYFIGKYFTKKIKFAKLFFVGLVCFMATIISVFVFYRPDLAGASGSSALSWAPFSLAHGIIESPDMFYLKSMTNARYFLYSEGRISPKLITIELFSALLYLFFAVGTRFVSVFSIVAKIIKRKVSLLDLSMITTVFGMGFLMLGFVQHADWFNTMQFFTFALIFLNVFTAESISIIRTKYKFANYILLIFFVFLTIPFALATAYSTISMMPKNGLVIKNEELEALDYLRKLPDGIVFTPVGGVDGITKKNNDATIWKHGDFSYIPALTTKNTYLAHQYQLYLLDVDYEERKKFNENPKSINFSDKNIKYLYLPLEHPHSSEIIRSLSLKKTLYKKIFDNSKYIIYEIN